MRDFIEGPRLICWDGVVKVLDDPRVFAESPEQWGRSELVDPLEIILIFTF